MATWKNVLLIAFLPLIAGPAFAQSQELFLNQDTTYQNIRVLAVISADTIRLENEQHVRLIGLKAPDKPQRKKVEKDQFGFVIKDNDPTLTLEERAFEFVKFLLEDTQVRLEFDAQKQDGNKILLAYVYVLESGQMANVEILRQGFAELSLRPPNLKYADQLRAAYQEARSEQRGLQGL